MSNNMKQQVFVIHGGETYDTYEDYLKSLLDHVLTEADLHKKRWKASLPQVLGNQFEVILPMMPNGFNAKFLEWSIWFEKHIPFLKDGIIFVGHSLGAIFLVKYFSENEFPVKIRATILISAPYDSEGVGTLADFKLGSDLSLFGKQGGKVILYHSTDDVVVPYAAAEKYTQALPSIELRTFSGRGHFNQESFPELLEEINGFSK
jgi:uncharacterized protein